MTMEIVYQIASYASKCTWLREVFFSAFYVLDVYKIPNRAEKRTWLREVVFSVSYVLKVYRIPNEASKRTWLRKVVFSASYVLNVYRIRNEAGKMTWLREVVCSVFYVLNLLRMLYLRLTFASSCQSIKKSTEIVERCFCEILKYLGMANRWKKKRHNSCTTRVTLICQSHVSICKSVWRQELSLVIIDR